MTNRIKELREERHFSQTRLSTELEVSQETISSYENGKHYPSVDNLIKLSDLLNASCDYILGLTDVRTPIIDMTLSSDEQLFIKQFRILTPNKRMLLKAYMDLLEKTI